VDIVVAGLFYRQPTFFLFTSPPQHLALLALHTARLECESRFCILVLAGKPASEPNDMSRTSCRKNIRQQRFFHRKIPKMAILGPEWARQAPCRALRDALRPCSSAELDIAPVAHFGAKIDILGTLALFLDALELRTRATGAHSGARWLVLSASAPKKAS